MHAYKTNTLLSLRPVKEYTGRPCVASPSKSTTPPKRHGAMRLAAFVVNHMRCTLMGAWSLAIHSLVAFCHKKVRGDVPAKARVPFGKGVRRFTAVDVLPALPRR